MITDNVLQIVGHKRIEGDSGKKTVILSGVGSASGWKPVTDIEQRERIYMKETYRD